MFLKPKMTTQNPRALLYRQFIDIVSTMSLKCYYKTTDNTDNKYWLFDNANLSFIEVSYDNKGEVVNVSPDSVLKYLDKCFKYSSAKGWQEANTTATLSLKFANIGKWQMNKYYYTCSFDYIKKGAIDDTLIQPIKGNMFPLQTVEIQYYNDFVYLKPSDLVVIGKHLFSVESVSIDEKKQPKDFRIYNARLNSIL